MGAKRLLALLAAGSAVSLVILLTPEVTSTILASTPEVGTNPHGTYATDSEMCELCHDPHRAQGPKLGVLQTEREGCYLCHDGGVATTDVRGDFGEQDIGISTRVSSHPVAEPRDGTRLACSDCHAPHQDPTTVTKLLAVGSGTELVYSSPDDPIGNAFCYACHGADSTLPGPFGDHTGFETSAHEADPDVPMPASGTEIKCLACHEAHGSDFRRLTTGDEEDLCFSCHNATTPNTARGTNPKRSFSVTPNDTSTADGDPIRIYHHPIATGEQDGGTRVVECASCHNPHLADATNDGTDSVVADPTDTRSQFPLAWSGTDLNRGNVADLCTACHVSPSTTDPIGTAPGVPYAIRMVDDAADDADGKPHDRFTASEWYASAAHGPAGANLACTACHDVHGSTNASVLRETVVSVDGSSTTTVTGYTALGSDWATLQAFCLTCHASTGTDHGSGQLCTQCHGHGSGRL